MRILAPILAALVLAAAATSLAPAQTDREAAESMQTRSSLACADYSTDRANPGFQALSPDILRILAKHKVFLCPERRIKSPIVVAWYPTQGALAWNPTDPAAPKVLALVAGQMTHTEDFPQGLEVWDAQGKKLSNMIVPEFRFKESYDGAR